MICDLFSDGLLILLFTLLLALLLHHYIDTPLQRLFNHPRCENPRISLALIFTGTLYTVALLQCAVTSPVGTQLDPTQKPFNWSQPLVPLWDYGLRFNRALDEGAVSLGSLTLAERIALNQEIRDASVFYIDWPSLRRNAGSAYVEATMEQLRAVANTGQWAFPAVHRGRGNYTLLLVGNSHADQVVRELRQEWVEHYSTMSTFTIGGML